MIASPEAVRAAVGAVRDPEIRRPIAELDMLDSIEVRDGVAEVALSLTVVGCPASDRIEREVREAAASVDGVREVTVRLGVMTPRAACGALRTAPRRADEPVRSRTPSPGSSR